MKAPIITSRVIIRSLSTDVVERSRILGLSREDFAALYKQDVIDHLAAPELQDYADGIRDMTLTYIEHHLCEMVYTLTDGRVMRLTQWAVTPREQTADCTFCLVWKGTNSVFSGPHPAF